MQLIATNGIVSEYISEIVNRSLCRYSARSKISSDIVQDQNSMRLCEKQKLLRQPLLLCMLQRKTISFLFNISQFGLSCLLKNYYHCYIVFSCLFFFGITSLLRGEKNAAFCKQFITMGDPMVFRWFSSSSLSVPKAPTTKGITVA